MSSFEKDIQNVFEGVEFQPSERVWAGVESALIAKKKKGFFYMWQTYGIAAGLAAIVSFGFLYNDGFFTAKPSLGTEELSKKEEDKNIEDPEGKSKENQSLASNKEDAPSDTQANADAESTSPKIQPLEASKAALSEQPRLMALAENNSPQNGTGSLQNKSALTEGVLSDGSSRIRFESLHTSLKPYRKSLAAEQLLFNAKMSLEPMHGSKQGNLIVELATESSSYYKENSLNGSFGNSSMSLSTNGNSNNIMAAEVRDPNSLNSLNTSVESGEDQVTGAISAGLGVTLDLSRRLSLNLGTRYSEFRFRNTSNAYSVEDGRSLPIYLPIGFNASDVFFVGVYDIENTIQSIFLQSALSYKLLTFGKFDIGVMAGVGMDYFLSYKVRGELNFLETRKVNPSESNFLNRTNLSGVSGFVVNYRINPQFGLSGDFNYRKFLNVSGNDVNSNPSSVVGFGLSVNYFLTRKED